MAKDASTWMAFYPGAYLSNTLHLTRSQHGSYFMLILAAFKAGGILPNNDATLAAIARCTPKEWAAERNTYAAFFEVTDETWFHERVSVEVAKAEALTNQRRLAGAAGAAKRQRPLNDRSAVADQNPATDAATAQRPLTPSQSHKNHTHGEISTDAARATACPDGPPRSRLLPDTARWAERLANHRPQEGKPNWTNAWGLSPDSAGHNPLIPPNLYREWRERYAREMAALKAGAAA